MMQDFLQEKYPRREGKKLSIGLIRENWISKVVALGLAVGFWYVFVPGSKTLQATYEIPVNVENLSPDFRLERIQPSQVTATFIGPRRAFYLFDPKTLKVTVDVSLAEMGRRTFPISEQNVRYPKELTLRDLSPSTLRISVKKVARGKADGQ